MHFQRDDMRLVAKGLSCIRGGRSLFHGLSFSLQAGEAILITGPNGAGKTSLLRMIAGLLTPAAGTIALDDAEVVGEHCHFVGHFDAVKGALTVAENLAFGSALLGGSGVPVTAALDRLGIGALKDLPGEVLSAGQRRRLALARLLAAPRPIWLLDEPTAALDAAGQQTLAELMREHRAHGGMVIAATHMQLDLDHAQEISLNPKLARESAA
jgi:heme exporter protein A